MRAAGQPMQHNRRPAGVVLCPELCQSGVRRRRLRQSRDLRQLSVGSTLQPADRAVSRPAAVLIRHLSERLLRERRLPAGQYRASLRHGRGPVRELSRIEVDVPERAVRLHAAVPGQAVWPGWLRRLVRDLSIRSTLQRPERVHPLHAQGQWERLVEGQRLLFDNASAPPAPTRRPSAAVSASRADPPAPACCGRHLLSRCPPLLRRHLLPGRSEVRGRHLLSHRPVRLWGLVLPAHPALL